MEKNMNQKMNNDIRPYTLADALSETQMNGGSFEDLGRITPSDNIREMSDQIAAILHDQFKKSQNPKNGSFD
jgi:hypothetical protein